MRREEFKLGWAARNNFLANFIAATRDARARARAADSISLNAMERGKNEEGKRRGKKELASRLGMDLSRTRPNGNSLCALCSGAYRRTDGAGDGGRYLKTSRQRNFVFSWGQRRERELDSPAESHYRSRGARDCPIRKVAPERSSG